MGQIVKGKNILTFLTSHTYTISKLLRIVKGCFFVVILCSACYLKRRLEKLTSCPPWVNVMVN